MDTTVYRNVICLAFDDLPLSSGPCPCPCPCPCPRPGCGCGPVERHPINLRMRGTTECSGIPIDSWSSESEKGRLRVTKFVRSDVLYAKFKTQPRKHHDAQLVGARCYGRGVYMIRNNTVSCSRLAILSGALHKHTPPPIIIHLPSSAQEKTLTAGSILCSLPSALFSTGPPAPVSS